MARLARSFGLLFSITVVTQGCSFLNPWSQERTGITHVVKRGENLFRIGKAYGIPYDELARTNRISNPHRIHAGSKIFIPGATRRLPVEIITPTKALLEKRPEPSQRRQRRRQGFAWPLTGRLTSRFGPRQKSFHDGIDIPRA